ncbi:uncharacterized protein HMPREF1120_06664 [Exophiala dermatitidis NIH/UT8656]|uniref:Uncharacterized protein n=1 Tax=Exophiala dermatitidis (strain ATCC 34100 / CBS 525.76 / NIH/UT8656) TaxID=858893 RepID=H6C1X3_EXODN|nr:uncharacterized protein HMPREF1120_06664 [Exophiala dermatitidis NIH/UT8656]EHY58660.1 hypothetical protein HMPREF1120_06664 [Exophiala dermatitidis NIH/UT8656]
MLCDGCDKDDEIMSKRKSPVQVHNGGYTERSSKKTIERSASSRRSGTTTLKIKAAVGRSVTVVRVIRHPATVSARQTHGRIGQACGGKWFHTDRPECSDAPCCLVDGGACVCRARVSVIAGASPARRWIEGHGRPGRERGRRVIGSDEKRAVLPSARHKLQGRFGWGAAASIT